MPRACNTDPLKTFRFRIFIDQFQYAGFKTMSGIEMTTEIAEYREGGWNAIPQKSDGLSNSGHVTLTRGIALQSDFYEWASRVIDAKQRYQLGYGATGVPPGQIATGVKERCQYRRNLSILLFDRIGNRRKEWEVIEAWPCRFKPTTDLDGTDTTGIAMEELELCNEGFYLVHGG